MTNIDIARASHNIAEEIHKENEAMRLIAQLGKRDSELTIQLAKDSHAVALATAKDSAAMQVIAAMTVLFLPATFTAVSYWNSLKNYVLTINIQDFLFDDVLRFLGFQGTTDISVDLGLCRGYSCFNNCHSMDMGDAVEAKTRQDHTGHIHHQLLTARWRLVSEYRVGTWIVRPLVTVSDRFVATPRATVITFY